MIQLNFYEFFIPIIFGFLTSMLLDYTSKFIINKALLEILKYVNNNITNITLSLIFITPVFIIFYYFFAPNIYVVKNCDFYESKKLINPFLKMDNIEFEFGNRCYVINESNNTLYYDEIVYGYGEFAVYQSKNAKHNLIIKPNTVTEFQFIKFNYLLKKPSKSITSKYSNRLLYYIGCQINN